MKTLITGCPRSGTGYIAALLRANKIPCTHEAKGRNSDRDSSWKRAGEHGRSMIKLHQTRNPIDCVASLRTVAWPDWGALVGREVGLAVPKKPGLLFLCEFWLAWNELASRGAALRYQVEQMSAPGPVSALVAAVLGFSGHEWDFSVPTDFNSRPHGPAEWSDILALGDVGRRVAAMASHYGYEVT